MNIKSILARLFAVSLLLCASPVNANANSTLMWQSWWLVPLYLLIFVVVAIWLTQTQQNKVKHERAISKELQEEVQESTAKLEQSHQSIMVFSEISADISASLDLNELMDTVYQRLGDLMDVDVFTIGLYDEQLYRLNFKFAVEDDERLPGFEISMCEKNYPAVLCAADKKPVVINDFQASESPLSGDKFEAALQSAADVKSVLYWPLTIGEKLLGVLTVQSYRKQAYDVHQQEMLNALALTIAIALDHATAYEAVAVKNKEILATQQQLVQAEKLASLGTLTAGVAHEINNPTNFTHAAVLMMKDEITEIVAFLEQLAGGSEADPKVIETIEKRFSTLNKLTSTATEGTTRIKSIVNNLGNFTRLDDTIKQTVKTAELVGSTVHLIKTQFDAVQFDIKIRFDPLIQCYPSKLSQVLMNLIVNACHAVESQAQAKVSISTSSQMGQLQISVQDNGSGMDERTQQKLFEPFFTTKEVGKGTGLGMAITFGIVEEHGGSIEVASELGLGTQVDVLLPLV